MADAYTQFFKDADKDNSGKLTFTELVNKLKACGYSGSDDNIKKLFHSADTSGDGEITLQEYLEVMQQVPPTTHKGATMRKCFNEFDKNNDGTIDRAELKQVFKELGKNFSDAELQRMIELGDKDSSSTLNYEEFIAEVFGQ